MSRASGSVARTTQPQRHTTRGILTGSGADPRPAEGFAPTSFALYALSTAPRPSTPVRLNPLDVMAGSFPASVSAFFGNSHRRPAPYTPTTNFRPSTTRG